MMKYLKYITILVVVFIISGYLILRYQFHFRYYDDIKFVKSFWTHTILNESPTEEWKSYLTEEALVRGSNVFYGFKVWFIDYSPDNPDKDLLSTEHASIIYRTVDGESIRTGNLGITFKYGDERQRLHAVVIKENGQFKINPSLSLDNCFWSPDIDGNGVIDQKDVKLAKEIKSKKNSNI